MNSDTESASSSESGQQDGDECKHDSRQGQGDSGKEVDRSKRVVAAAAAAAAAATQCQEPVRLVLSDDDVRRASSAHEGVEKAGRGQDQEGNITSLTPRKYGGRYCIVVNCHNSTYRDVPRGIKFYCFPMDPTRRQQWTVKVNRLDPKDGSLWTPKKGTNN
jgi:hypothetical protein